MVSTCPQINVNSECKYIVPGDVKLPKSILNIEYCEELSFSHLFPARKFGYKFQRKIPLTLESRIIGVGVGIIGGKRTGLKNSVGGSLVLIC